MVPAFALIAVFVAFTFRSLTGFGGALLAIPVLAQHYPLTFVIPMECLLEVALSALMLPLVWKDIQWKHVTILLLGATVGSVIGVHLLSSLPLATLKPFLGVFIILVAVWVIVPIRGNVNLPSSTDLAFGLLGGVLGGLFGSSGPAYIACLTLRGIKGDQFRATLIAIFAAEYSLRAFLYFRASLIDTQTVTLAAQLLPAVLIGLLFGHRISLRLSNQPFSMIVSILLFATGLLTLTSPA